MRYAYQCLPETVDLFDEREESALVNIVRPSLVSDCSSKNSPR